MQRIRKNRYLQLVVALAVFGFVFGVRTPKASAAACTNPTTDYGTVTSTVAIPATGTYRVWSRIQIPSSAANSYLLEITEGTTPTCFTVGANASLATNTWTWVDYQSGTTTNKVSMTLSSGTHNVRMIGNADGVLLDRVIFTQDTNCVPSGTGNNCASPTDPTVSINSPAPNASVPSGTVSVGATVTPGTSAVSKVEFYIDGALKTPADTTSPYTYSWDTTGLTANSPHTIVAKVYDSASTPNVGTSPTVNVTIAGTVTVKPGDTNNDNVVDLTDLTNLAVNYGQSGKTRSQGDFDGNGIVDLNDLTTLVSNWGR